MLRITSVKLFKTNINSILLIFIFCALVVSFISATKLSKIHITTLDIINFDPKSVHTQSLDIQTLDIESLDIETLDIESLDIETLDIESLDIETLDIEDSDLKRSYLQSIDLYKSDINADLNTPDLNIDNYNINFHNLLRELIDSRSLRTNDLMKIAVSGLFETSLGMSYLERFKTDDNDSLLEQYKILVGNKPIYTTKEGFDVLVSPIGCTNNSCEKSIKFIKFY